MTHSVKFILLITMTLILSLAANGKVQLDPIVTVAQRPTVTRSVPVRVNVQKIHKPKIFVGNPHKITLIADDRDDNFLEVDDIITPYRREDLQKIEHEDGISDYIRWRLFLARQLALLKYKEVHG